MITKRPLFFTAVLVFLTPLLSIGAVPSSSSLVNRRANAVEEKRFAKHMWPQTHTNSLINKRFAFEHWSKHFSPLGSKRAPIKLTEKSEKIEFTTKLIDREEVKYDMSRWNQQMADLHRNAGIEMDNQAQLAFNSKLYHMLLQDRKKFGDLGKEVSLRDINRYQFRRNRSDGDIPINKAGADQ